MRQNYALLVGAIALRVSSAKISVAAMGDSITEGKDPSTGSKDQSWPAQLDRLLGDEVWVRNFGKSGRTVQATKDAYTATKFWTSALQSDADVGIIALGTNDAKDEFWVGEEAFLEAYRDIIATATATFDIVCLAVPIPQLREGWHWSNTSIINEILPALVESLAKEYELPLIDPRGAFVARHNTTTQFGQDDYLNASLYRDVVHPTELGYSAIAKAVQEVLVRILLDDDGDDDGNRLSPTPHPTIVPTATPTSTLLEYLVNPQSSSSRKAKSSAKCFASFSWNEKCGVLFYVFSATVIIAGAFGAIYQRHPECRNNNKDRLSLVSPCIAEEKEEENPHRRRRNPSPRQGTRRSKSLELSFTAVSPIKVIRAHRKRNSYRVTPSSSLFREDDDENHVAFAENDQDEGLVDQKATSPIHFGIG